MEEARMFRFSVGAEEHGRRFDLVLRRHFPDRSRSFCQKLILEGLATVNQAKVKPSHAVRRNDALDVRVPRPKELEIQAEDIPLEVLYEDEFLLVINKPPGMVVHPAAGNPEHTLVHALLHHCRGRLSGVGGVLRPGIVHRLDKDTSGCLVVAKDDATHRALVEQFQEREVSKEYLALVWGRVAKSHGRLEAAIGRSRHDRHKMAVTTRGGKPAVTEFEVLERFQECTALRVTIHTGRTHQIRVHLTSLGHPVVGDTMYGRKRHGAWAGAVPRQMLHAHRLAFEHPRTQKLVAVTAPLPADLRGLIQQLRADVRKETVPQ